LVDVAMVAGSANVTEPPFELDDVIDEEVCRAGSKTDGMLVTFTLVSEWAFD
jgi:hypothetical protein